MAMFARRSLQRMLDTLAVHIELEARRKLARELNRRSGSALGFEWELGLLYALSRVGAIEYETQFAKGMRRPDLTFREAGGPIAFVADITTVSDVGLEAENPVKRFSVALHRLKRKYGLVGGLHYDIKGEAEGTSYQNRKMRLKLPPGSQLDPFLKAHVEPEFQRIRDAGLSIATISINEPGVEFSVVYQEGVRYGSGHYPSYTAAYSRTRNPVYNALKAKPGQLKQSGQNLPSGIFLCDGGCRLLSFTKLGGEPVTLENVIAEFFRRNSSVSFVVILSFPPPRAAPFTGITKELRITGWFYSNPRAAHSLPAEELLALINRGLAELPSPVATPGDALNWIATADALEGRPINTIELGDNMITRSIKISARKVQEVLAGHVTPEQLFDNCGAPDARFENPFAVALGLRLTMKTITLTKLPDADDDLLEITFGLPDPALGQIKVSEE